MKNLLKVSLLLIAFTVAARAQELGISLVGWSSNGKYLVTVNSASRRVRVHDGATGAVIKATTAPGEKKAYVSFSPDSGREEPNSLISLGVAGDYALTAGVDNALHWWRLPGLQLAASSEATYSVRGVSLGGEGKVGACTCTSSRDLDSEMNVLRMTDGAIEAKLFSELAPPDSSESFGVASISPDGLWAVGKMGDDAQVWRVQPAETEKVGLVGLKTTGLAMGNRHFFAIVPDGVSMRSYDAPDVEVRRFACKGAIAASVDGCETRLIVRAAKLHVWDLASTAPPQEWDVSAEALWSAPDMARLALRRANQIEVWDVPTRKKLYVLPAVGKLP